MPPLSHPLPFEQPLGAFPDGTFRVWAPRAERVSVRVDGEEHEMRDLGFGVWEATSVEGDDYRFALDGEAWPDPCSRWQPDGLRGSSRVWRGGVARGPGVDLRDAVLYELHIGTFTRDGTFDAAIEFLPELTELGVTAVEVMPIAEFPGRHGWGYDGVYLSAAHSAYGGPEGFARFVEAAHGVGLGVVLDVVYNHVGASGVKALEAFGPYFTDKHETFWGKAINFDDEDCGGTREWVLQSAEFWVGRMGVDGLRVDAIHAIKDDGARHVVQELAERVHAVNENAVVIAESALNDPKVIRPKEHGGLGCDAQWADDFHHCVRTLLTGEKEGYYEEYGEVGQLAKAFHRPFVFDGTYSPHRRRRFGAKADDREPHQFVVFIQNHDHVGNRALGDRLPAEVHELAAFCVLLSPFVPMLFQGEEYGEPAPFQFFSDHIDEEIAIATRDGRLREFAQFEAFAGQVPDPQDEQTFLRSKLTRRERPGVRDLYARLIAERRTLGEVRAIDFDEDAKWLRVERAGGTLVMNFGREAVTVDGEEVAPMSGALIR
ncbi:MAG TPA: malto-oligosyltrehalose trehalohydrolase [Solirubrobacteraceae bacterium]